MFHDKNSKGKDCFCVFCAEAIIGCFVCSSVNGSDPACEDPFNAINASYYHQDCRAGRKGRVGLFPATNCIKVKGELSK